MYTPPPPAFPAFRAVLNWAMWVGGRIVMRRPTPPTTWLSFIPPSPQNRQFSSFRLSSFRLLRSCPPAAHFHSGRTTFFIFSFFQNAWNPPVPWLCRALPYTNYTKLQFRVISSVISFVMQSYQGFAGFRQSPGIVLRLRRLPAVCQAAAIPQC